jgi:RNA polymerase sigma-70 factor (family 1)
MPPTPDDTHLFHQIATGNETAFREIFHKYTSKLYPAVFKIVKDQNEAEEIIQNLFLKLWLKKETLTEIENPGAWLYRVASNLALSSLRKQAQVRASAKIIQHQYNEEEHITPELDAKELNQLVNEAIQQLPAGRRQIYTLSRQQGMNRQEIATQLGVSESTVKNQLSSALKFIQQYINSRHGIYLPVIFFLPFLSR